MVVDGQVGLFGMYFGDGNVVFGGICIDDGCIKVGYGFVE